MSKEMPSTAFTTWRRRRNRPSRRWITNSRSTRSRWIRAMSAPGAAVVADAQVPHGPGDEHDDDGHQGAGEAEPGRRPVGVGAAEDPQRRLVADEGQRDDGGQRA